MSLVIIGCGPYGISLANRYKKKYPSQHIVLIALQEDTMFLPAAPRSIVDGDVTRNVIPISELLNPKVTFIKGRVIQINETYITYENFKGLHRLEFAVLVVATGSKHSLLTTNGDFFSVYGGFKRAIADARKIVLLGGGEVSVAIAGEIHKKYPEKSITIIHKLSKILTDKYKNQIRDQVTAKLGQMNVLLLLGFTGTLSGDDILATNRNKEVTVKADCIINGIGNVHGCFPPLGDSLKHIVDEKNYGIVDSDFTTDVKNIFAVGDVAKVGSFDYMDQYLEVAMHNIHLALTHGAWKGPYFRKATISVTRPSAALSLGPDYGYGQTKLPILGTVKLPNRYVVGSKSKDLMVSKIPKFYSVNWVKT